MKIETTRFGTISVEEDKIIHMPSGMLGFSDKKRFLLFGHKEKTPFCWYQSVDDPAMAFVVMSPFVIKPDYAVEADEAAKAMSWEDDGDDIDVYVVVTIPRGEPEKMTANLLGPILINARTRQGIQMVISNSPYSHKFPIEFKAS